MDRQTMKDLEIFYSEGDSKSLFEMLNHTYTSGGENALRRRFLHPFCDKESIEETQKIVQYFLTQLGSWQMHIKENDMHFAEKYMASGIVVFDISGGLAGWLTAKRFQHTQPDYFHFLKSGIINLIDLFLPVSGF